MSAILVAENLGKKFYRNPNRHVGYGISDLLREIVRLPPRTAVREEEFWAVKDVTFSLQPGQSLGVIGRNGSGKTTLMKLLTGLLRHDAGSVEAAGNVQALINLGAGFNPSLSGRENIINGAAMRGLSLKQLKGRIDDIIEFSELGAFIDGPVSTYSSGMRARLGFSMCAHLDPSIIVIDEALSVGDLAFQNKCLTRLEHMKRQGVVMVLVSHSMTHVRQFCEDALWLHEGVVQAQGKAADVIKAYVHYMDSLIDRKASQQSEASEGKDDLTKARERESDANAKRAAAGRAALPERSYCPGSPALESGNGEGEAAFGDASGTQPCYLGVGDGAGGRSPAPADSPTPEQKTQLYGGYLAGDAVSHLRGVLLVDNRPVRQLRIIERCAIEYMFDLEQEVSDLNVSLVFYREDGLHMTSVSTLNGDLLKRPAGRTVHCRVTIAHLGFAPGKYVVMMPIHEGRSYLHRDCLLTFTVVSGGQMTWGLSNLDYRYDVFGGPSGTDG